MSLRLGTSHLRHINHVFSRAFATSTHRATCRVDDQELSSCVDRELLALIQQHGSVRTPYLLNKIISFCAKTECISTGVPVHSAIIKMGVGSNIYICSALVDMYGKCGLISTAQQLFDEIPRRNAVTWNSLISGYLHVGCPETAIGLFLEMLRALLAPTPFTVSAVLAGCSQLEAEELGAQVHGLSWKTGFCLSVVVGTGLIDMYSRCSNVDTSRQVFNQMPDRNIITWTSMIAGYALNSKPNEATLLFREMLRLGLRPNYITCNSLLSSFCDPDYFNHCKQVHCRIIQEGFESNVYIAVTLVTVYSECSNSLEDFCSICLGIIQWDQISWNAVIGGFGNLGNGEDALKHFSKMRQAGVAIDLFTFTSILKAIGHISALEEGKQTHALVFKAGCASNTSVQNGLVSMYARCGAISDSMRVFSSLEKHDLISWNSLLSGCASHGYGKEAVEVFEQMRNSGVKPDSTSFLALLSACSHVGLLDKGLEYFELMTDCAYFETPKVEHYACIVNMLGRAGYLQEAEEFINSMPIEPGSSVYKSLLSACHVHGNKEIAIHAAKKLLELQPNDSATYVLLSKVLAAEGCWDDATGVWKLMQDSGVRKNPGYSWI